MLSLVMMLTKIPVPIDAYDDANLSGILEMLVHRIELEPFNLFATVVFILAILHSFSTSWFNKKAAHYHHLFEEKKIKGLVDPMATSMMAGLLHFCGEIEAVFGIWTIVLGIGTTFYYDWHTFVEYVSSARYVEPLLIIVIMTMASSRPILKLFELILWRVVKLFGGSLEAWWFTILTLGPLLGSFITEPAAMVVTAMLLSEKFFVLNPSKKIKYGMLSLLLVNISIGGTLSNFASPPILMVAGAWDWSNAFMLLNFGWKAILAITLNNVFFFFLFKKELLGLKTAFETNQYQKYIQRKFISKKKLETIFDSEEHKIDESLGFTDRFLQVSADIKEKIKSEAMDVLSDEELIRYNISHTLDQRFENIKLDEMKRTIPGLLPNEQRPLYRDPNWNSRDDKVPYWIMAMHIFFMLWTLANAHEPILFIAGFLFYLGFFQVSAFYQNRMDLKPALMVAFFLSGLVVHGGLQGWWIQPVLSNLSEGPLHVVAIVLTSFNDNASITYLSSLVPSLTDSMKYAVVAGAVTGGGLTLIANSPNPIAQSLLKQHFKNGISAGWLALYALPLTVIASLCFMLF